jgi:L-ascorbate metabolism protein UlaG (beta-lactamase superfamily)
MPPVHLPLTGFLIAAVAACSAASSQPPPAGDPAERAARVTLTYLGVAGWQLTDGKHTILLDPYFSRPDLPADDSTLIAPDEAAIAARVPARADLILVGHSHFDHLLDVPSVARLTGAQVLGTESTARVALAAGLPADRVIPVKGGEDYQFEGFSVRVIPSLHSALDDKHVLGGNTVIPEGITLPMARKAYAEGGTLAFLVRISAREVLLLGTANFIERELEGIHPAAAVVAVGLREEIHRYSCRLMSLLGQPPLVLATHFDAWKQPLGSSSQANLTEDSRADLARFPGEITACAPGTRVVIPEYFTPIDVGLR